MIRTADRFPLSSAHNSGWVKEGSFGATPLWLEGVAMLGNRAAARDEDPRYRLRPREVVDVPGPRIRGTCLGAESVVRLNENDQWVGEAGLVDKVAIV